MLTEMYVHGTTHSTTTNVDGTNLAHEWAPSNAEGREDGGSRVGAPNTH